MSAAGKGGVAPGEWMVFQPMILVERGEGNAVLVRRPLEADRDKVPGLIATMGDRVVAWIDVITVFDPAEVLSFADYVQSWDLSEGEWHEVQCEVYGYPEGVVPAWFAENDEPAPECTCGVTAAITALRALAGLPPLAPSGPLVASETPE